MQTGVGLPVRGRERERERSYTQQDFTMEAI